MKDILKGLLIGLGKIMPGVSGSVIAISLGVYEKAISALNNFYKNKDDLIYLIKILLGILISIAFMGKVIIYLLTRYYSYTIFLFAGLILGSSSDIKQHVKKKYWYLSIISFITIVIFSFISNPNSVIIKDNTIYFLYYFFSGFVDAIATVIPGISGTALLMLLGSYKDVASIFSNILNFSFLINHISMLLPFIFGMLFGLFLSLKLVNILFRKCYYQTYSIILGLLYGSVFIMLKTCSYNFSSILIGLLLFIFSFIFIKKINHFL